MEAAIRRALDKGDRGIIKIATAFGVGVGTVQRIKAATVGVKGPEKLGAKPGAFRSPKMVKP